MTTKTLNYAKAHIDAIAEENGIKPFIFNENLWIELQGGRQLKIHEDEVITQAIEFLQDEIRQVNQIR